MPIQKSSKKKASARVKLNRQKLKFSPPTRWSLSKKSLSMKALTTKQKKKLSKVIILNRAISQESAHFQAKMSRSKSPANQLTGRFTSRITLRKVP